MLVSGSLSGYAPSEILKNVPNTKEPRKIIISSVFFLESQIRSLEFRFYQFLLGMFLEGIYLHFPDLKTVETISKMFVVSIYRTVDTKEQK